MFQYMANRLADLFQGEDGQDAFEYALVVGGISVVVVIAIAALGALSPGLVSAVCGSINTALPIDITCP